MRILKLLAELNKRCARHRSVLWKDIIARIGERGSLLLIDLITRPGMQHVSKNDERLIKKLVLPLVKDAPDELAAINRLCVFVNREIIYFCSDRWMSPCEVLRFGIGDCKNQATLLESLLACIGVKSNIIVGVVNRNCPMPRIHAWVRVSSHGRDYIADPTVSGSLFTKQEYKQRMSGFVDVTPEYKKRTKDSIDVLASAKH